MEAVCFVRDFDILGTGFLAAAVRVMRELDEGDKVAD